MRIVRWIPKATDTHSEYVILIAFPLQQWLRERASLLLCTYILYIFLLGQVKYGSKLCALILRNFSWTKFAETFESKTLY